MTLVILNWIINVQLVQNVLTNGIHGGTFSVTILTLTNHVYCEPLF